MTGAEGRALVAQARAARGERFYPRGPWLVVRTSYRADGSRRRAWMTDRGDGWPPMLRSVSGDPRLWYPGEIRAAMCYVSDELLRDTGKAFDRLIAHVGGELDRLTKIPRPRRRHRRQSKP